VVLTIFLALGAWRLSKNKVLTRKSSVIETLGSATVLCSDKTGTITQNKMEVAVLYAAGKIYSKTDFINNEKNISPLLENLLYASQENSIDPMEKAIVRESEKNNLLNKNARFIKEYPLSKELFAMSRVFELQAEKNTVAFCKGAPEAVFKLCSLPQIEIASLTHTIDEFAEKGYRVLAAAKAICDKSNLPAQQSGFNFTFTGLVGFEDPIRPEVPQAMSECIKAGIKVIMITGDYPATAKNIADQIGLPHNGIVLTGAELQSLSKEELKEKNKKHTRIFARIVPEQKLYIIQALKANGEIVAMTGDGVNDAPALKAADIGVSMGLKGTDVAREASSLVLLDDNFASIVQAIRSGRRIFDNLQKSYVLYNRYSYSYYRVGAYTCFFPLASSSSNASSYRIHGTDYRPRVFYCF